MAIKILHVTPSFGFGGMEKIISSLINSTEGYLHTILPLDGNVSSTKWITRSNASYIRFSRPESRKKFFFSLWHIIKEVRPDLLMTYNWGGTDAIWIGRIAGVKLIIHNEHGFNMDEAGHTYRKRDLVRVFVYHLTSHVIIVSRYLEDIMRRRYYVTAGRCSFIPNGVNTDHYCPDLIDRERVRRQLGFDENDTVAIFCGRLDPVKNFDLMLRIIEEGLSQGKNLKLLIVGSGRESSRIKKMAIAKGIDEKVHQVGEVQDVVSYLRAADIFLMTSWREQMPLSVLEAMAVGLPVVASKTGELPNLIEYGKEGFLEEISAGHENFTKVLLRLTDKRERERMGKLARNKVVVFLDEERTLEKYRTLVEAVLARERPKRKKAG